MKRFLRAWWAWAADVIDDALDGRGVPRKEPNKVDLAMKVERALIARYLREVAGSYRLTSTAAHAALMSAANRIAGGMYYR